MWRIVETKRWIHKSARRNFAMFSSMVPNAGRVWISRGTGIRTQLWGLPRRKKTIGMGKRRMAALIRRQMNQNISATTIHLCFSCVIPRYSHNKVVPKRLEQPSAHNARPLIYPFAPSRIAIAEIFFVQPLLKLAWSFEDDSAYYWRSVMSA